MAKKANSEALGKWAFIIGAIVAVLIAFMAIPYSGILLVILGIAIGLLNIGAKDVEPFLIAVIALLVAGTASIQALNVLVYLGPKVLAVIGNLIAFIAPAALIVALKQVYALASKP